SRNSNKGWVYIIDKYIVIVYSKGVSIILIFLNFRGEFVSKRILIEKEPKIRGYLHHAFPLSSMASHPSFLPWFYSNYIQLFCYKDLIGDACPLNFYRYHDWNYYPLLDNQYLKRDLLLDTSVTDFIKHAIESDYCIYTIANEYYIPGSEPYQKYDFDHCIMIYGYDSVQKKFHSINFNDNWEYSDFDISFEQFEKAIHHVGTKLSYAKQIRMFKPDLNVQFNFNLNFVIDMLQDYLNSCNRSDRFSVYATDSRLIFGIQVYDEFFRYVEKLLNRKVESDIRPFHIIWEHKKVMLERIAFIKGQMNLTASQLTEIQIIEEAYKLVEEVANTIRIKMLKYLLTNRDSYLQGMLDEIKDLKNKEIPLIEKLIEFLEKSNTEMKSGIV
ncbi:hypothetical protein DUZ99_19645, partial [Xylanibacillus composti]